MQNFRPILIILNLSDCGIIRLLYLSQNELVACLGIVGLLMSKCFLAEKSFFYCLVLKDLIYVTSLYELALLLCEDLTMKSATKPLWTKFSVLIGISTINSNSYIFMKQRTGASLSCSYPLCLKKSLLRSRILARNCSYQYFFKRNWWPDSSY